MFIQPEKCRVERKAWFEQRFRKLYDEAVRSRLDEQELQEILNHLGKEWSSRRGTKLF